MALLLECIVLQKNTILHTFMYIIKMIKQSLDINKCELVEGKLPKNKLRVVLAWVELRKEELLADWKLAENGELPFKIEPLK
jgi:hypothetical protein